MVQINNISNVVHSAMAKIDPTGDLRLVMGGGHVNKRIGHRAGDEMRVNAWMAGKLHDRAPMHLPGWEGI
jgi:hypothetical protein